MHVVFNSEEKYVYKVKFEMRRVRINDNISILKHSEQTICQQGNFGQFIKK